MAVNILVVEDDTDINNLLAELLRRAGHRVAQAFSGTEALLHLERGRHDLMLLDLMLPGLTGEEVIARVRERGSLPVIILSARETPHDKAALLRLGADDYMTKPFDEEELLARVDNALRRAGSAGTGGGAAGGKLEYKHLAMDTQARTLTVHGKAVQLTAREFDILALLLQSPAKVFTKSNIYASVWREAFMGDENTVNVHISNLRAKLGAPEVIQTVWGIGFKLAE